MVAFHVCKQRLKSICWWFWADTARNYSSTIRIAKVEDEVSRCLDFVLDFYRFLYFMYASSESSGKTA